MKRAKKIILILILFLGFIIFSDKAFAAEKACNLYASEGSSVCSTKSYQGKKCKWDGSKKGGARCYQSNILSDEKKETITSCSQINESETCQSSKVKGVKCIWRQNACRSAEDDGSDTTVITDDEGSTIIPDADAADDDSSDEDLAKVELGDPLTCDSLKNMDTYKIISQIFKWLQIVAPIMLVIFGVIDFATAVAASDAEAIKKAQGKFVKRVIVVAIIILLPFIMDLLVSLLDGAMGNDVSTCNIGK